MNDSTLSSAVVSRVLQVTRQSWAQNLAVPVAARAPAPRKLSSHRWAMQQVAQNTARRQRQPWGLQPSLRQAHVLEL
jgi:hypothetical protein